MRKKIIAIVGMPGAGKSETASFFRKKGFPVLRFGDETDLGLKELGKQLTEKNERWYREKIRKELGMAAYAIRIKPRIDKETEKNNIVILDGLYSGEEYTYLKKKFPDIILLCIHASPKIRYERLSRRETRGIDAETARKRDIAELEKLNKGGPIAIADYLIENNKTLYVLEKELEKFLSSIK